MRFVFQIVNRLLTAAHKIDSDEGEAGGDSKAWSEKKLRKLFSHAVAHHSTAAPASKSIVARTR